MLRVTIVWFMYSNFIELLRDKGRVCFLAFLNAVGLICYTVYTFGLHISQDVENPFRMLSLLGLALMFGSTYGYIRKLRKEKRNDR